MPELGKVYPLFLSKCEAIHTPGRVTGVNLARLSKRLGGRKPCSIPDLSNAAIIAEPAKSPNVTNRSHSVSGATRAIFSVEPRCPWESATDAARRIGIKTQKQSLKTSFGKNTE